MKLQLNTPVDSFDLANAVENDSGTYICQNGGTTYLLVAKPGHSIAFGPTPIGRKVNEVPQNFNLPTPWTLTKISEEDISEEFMSGGTTSGKTTGSRR